MTIIYDPNDNRQVDRVVELLKKGKAVALPTETVYGLAGLALKDTALANIFKLKNRPTFDPLIVHVLGVDDITKLVKEVSALHKCLTAAFWPGPLTLLFEKKDLVPDLCTASTSLVAIRSPSHPVFREILRRLKQPLAAPSANRFGRISTTLAEDVVKELGPFGLEAVLDGGPCSLGIESTVLKINRVNEVHSLEIVRVGALSVEAILKVVPSNMPLSIRESGSGSADQRTNYEAPGQLKSHYAPRAQLRLFSKLSLKERQEILTNPSAYRYLEVFPDGDFRQKILKNSLPAHRITLSESSNDVEAAARLFSSLRSLDEQNPKAIILGDLPTSKRGLCPAIFDRLNRAMSVNP